MKKLMIFLTILLLSLFIVPRGTLALSYSDYHSTIVEGAKTDYDTYKNDIALIDSYIQNNNFTTGFNIGDGKYIILYRLNTFNTNSKNVRLIDITSGYVRNYYGGNYDMYKRFDIQYGGASCDFSINNGVVSKSNCSIGSYNNWIGYTTCNPTLNNCDITFDSWYLDTSYVSPQYENSTYEFRAYNSSSITEIPLKVKNVIYNQPTTIESLDIFNAIAGVQDKPICSKTAVLGAVGKPGSLTFNVKGKSNILDYPLQGYFDIDYVSSSTLTPQDFNVVASVNTDHYHGDWDLICSPDSSKCSLYYAYNYADDIDFDLELTFVVSFVNNSTRPSFVKLYNCSLNDQYDNVSYTYTTDLTGSSDTTDNQLNNFLNDGSLPDVSGTLNPNNIVPSGPVDAILLLPLNLLNSLTSTLSSKTCHAITVPIPFVNSNVTLPCLNTIYSQIEGLNVFLNSMSIIISGFLLYYYFINLYKWIDDTLTFRENNHFGGY